MKKYILIYLMTVLSVLASGQSITTAATKVNSESLQKLMDNYTNKGIPGISIAVYSPSLGYWTGASGYASIELKKPMQPSHLQYAQSVSKTYLAVSLLQLQEQGLIALDSYAAGYLPGWITKQIPILSKVTIRMLLNHSSGLPDYADDKIYVVDLLQNPTKKFTINDFISYIVKKKQLFEPGTDYSYCNMNTELAALIVDKLTGDHAQYMQKNIFQRAGLQHSFYHTPGYLEQPEMVDSYWDRYSNGVFENVTSMQRANVGNMIGDDGLVATPIDYINFLKAVFDEKLISKQSLEQMKTGVKAKDGKMHGGLGLFYMEMAGIGAYGHGGAGVGAGCLLLYVPAKQTYIFLGTNMGTITGGPLSTRAEEFKNELLSMVLQ